MLNIPAAVHEFGRQPVQQFLVDRRFTLGADIVEDLRNSGPEKQLPKPVDEHACGQRVFAIGEPVAQIKPGEALAPHRNLLKEVRGPRLNDLAGSIHPVAPRQHADFPRLDRLTDESFVRVVDQRLLAALKLADLLPIAVAPSC